MRSKFVIFDEMKLLLYTVPVLFFLSCNKGHDHTKSMEAKVEIKMSKHVIVIHGGAGSRTPGDAEGDTLYNSALQYVLHYGDSMLSAGANAVDVVEHCLILMEDNPLFNAGKGAVFAADGRNYLDASIMNGSTMNAGAVAGVSIVKNPISAARVVMDSSAHVLLSHDGADHFAAEHGLETVNPSYFFTQKNYDYLLKVQDNEKTKDEKHGTVGCVVLDKKGHLAAGTSTGGMTNKRFGRIGDSPIIGAGTYAEDGVCAVSATGHGEFFIRYAVAHDIAARIKYGGSSLDSAANTVIMENLKNVGGAGGVICVDNKGNIAMPFNTNAMFRGYVRAEEEMVVLIYPE